MGVNKININNNDSNYTHSIFDISEYTGKTYDTLSDALADIPDGKKKGGMTVSYVQDSESDNKYVQYRLMTNEWSINTEDWSITYESVCTDNPEFVYVETDKDGKTLWAIKIDGDIYYGVGCPQQVKDYIEEKISSLPLDEYEDIVSFLSDYLGSDTTLKIMIDGINAQIATKVAKVEGKSLIDADYASTKSSIEDSKLLEVTTDLEGKVLSGRTSDGAAFENIGFSTPKMSIDGHIIENIEDLEGRSEVTTDSEGKIISYRDSEGVKHELVGFKTKEVISNSGNIDVLNTKEINFVGVNPTKATSVYLERPKFAEFYFYGNLPTDQSSERIPTTLDFIYKVNGQALLSARCTLAIQGHGSAYYAKKGYTFEPINVDGDAIEIKWGDMIAVDSFHLKAYYVDKTHSHGIAGPRVWRKMIEQLPYPYNKVNNKALNLEKGQKINAYSIADAKYSEDGFPFAFYLNDEFHGLYTIKLKKSRANYGMEKGNKDEIFLDSLGFDDAPGHSAKLDDSFDAGAWDLKNPKLKNYEEGGPITDATVLANIERLFDFTNNITTMYAQHKDYIVLPHWLTWFIHCELLGDGDKDGNNLELCTWDGTHWSILPYDMDLTVGAYGGQIIPTKTGYVLPHQFYVDFRNCFEQEIKELYTKLRKSGCIEINNLYKTYLGQIESIPRFIYEMDAELWPDEPWDVQEWPVIEMTYTFIQSRIEYLDSVWLINN